MAKITLFHFSKEPLVLDSGYTYENHSKFKPDGLWLSDEQEYGWSRWCYDNEFAIHHLKHKTAITVETNEVVTINGDAGMDWIEKNYGCPIVERDVTTNKVIDWIKFKDDHKGIIITPYLNRERFRFWYWGWDCASACVWDLSVIKDVAQL